MLWLGNNAWVRRRARKIMQCMPYVSRKDAILSALGDLHYIR